MYAGFSLLSVSVQGGLCRNSAVQNLQLKKKKLQDQLTYKLQHNLKLRRGVEQMYLKRYNIKGLTYREAAQASWHIKS